MSSPFARPARFEPAEWEARVQLAAAYRIFDLLGWTEMIYNHLSLRVPGQEAHYLINPFGLHYREVTASNLVKVDARGGVVGHSDWPINPAGFTFHGAIHATLPDAHCVMHVHTTPTMAVCCLEEGLSFSNFYAAQLWGQVAYHDFEGITVHLDEGQRILASATVPGAPGQAARVAPVLLLRNHGPVVIGHSLPQALGLMWLVQRACEVQLASMSMGACRPIPVPVMERCVRDSLNFNPNFGAGQDVFDAMQRQVDAIDPGYRR
ncbi:class II aldolase/adducin family protein [Ideonella sp. A 288]|uniref:class II aldolase/adducin family protein n=1 Tax=Ideonella sp. A 288 TaxID=1962181 RepID=UPI000B4BFA52|nr:class II aldolase/adducin family protein [Ideonella sp. A 288]